MSYQLQQSLPLEIFRAYDIRGIVGKNFTEDNLYTLGLALGSEALDRGINAINVGRDGRLSGPALLEAFIAGLLKSGCNVTNVGEVTTPMLYYAASNSECKSGLMLSGSHNPPNYNGLKIVLGGETLYGEAIKQIYQRILNKNYHSGQGSRENYDLTEAYFQAVINNVHLNRPLKIVVDCGNGVGGKYAPLIFKKLGNEVCELFCEVDGSFPNHEPDPSVPKNLVALISKVQQGYDVGLAFDGDADRVVVVTEKGEIISSDRLLTLFALDLLKRHSEKPIIFDIKCSRLIKQQIEAHGGIPIRYKTGHSLIKAKMKEVEAYLAGELSGHIFMKERWYGFDDGIYVAARFLELLTKQKQSVTQLFSSIPKTCSTPEFKINVQEEEKFSVMETLIKNLHFEEGVTDTIDGLRVDFPDGFGLIRPSNTSPYLIACFEGDNQESLARIQSLFSRQIGSICPHLVIPF